jgi:tetratricopeptide (TPR) repeat protein
MKCPQCSHENPTDTRFCGQCGSPFEMADIPTITIQAQSGRITRGSVLAGRYEIIEEIGRGGMGWVYKIYDQKIDEKIAIKLINPAVAQDPTVIERFNNELKIARRIIHKNVCRMYELTEADGKQFITMEYIQGEDLKSLINRIGQLPLRKTVAIARQICDGLAEAHALGIVHRDLKPQNIMIDLKGNVRITDFGIAQSVFSKGLTKTGMIIGTPEYMSPEQVEGIAVDLRSDIYSLGIILYEMVTGVVPFEGTTPLSLAMKHKTERPKAPRSINGFIPEPLDRLILKCLEKDPDKRYQTAKALSEDLASIEQDLPTTEGVGLLKPKKSSTRTVPSGKKLKWGIPALGITVLAAVLLILWFTVLKPGDKGSVPVPAPRPNELVGEGHTLWRDQKPDEALAKFQAALELDPTLYEAQISLARVLKALERFDDSIPAYEKAIQLDPEEAYPYKELGEIYQQKQDVDQALIFYKDFLSRSETGPESDRISRIIKDLETAQTNLDDTNKTDEGKDEGTSTDTTEKKVPVRDLQAERAEQIRQTLTRARNAYASGRFAESMKFARQVLVLDPDNPEAKGLVQQSEVGLDSAAIGALISAYGEALTQAQLAAFYQTHCTPQLYTEIKSDAELIASLYTNFKSEITNKNIRFLDERHAEASFGHRIKGTSKQEGTEQQLFQGNTYWELQKDQNQWRIATQRSESFE